MAPQALKHPWHFWTGCTAPQQPSTGLRPGHHCAASNHQDEARTPTSEATPPPTTLQQCWRNRRGQTGDRWVVLQERQTRQSLHPPVAKDQTNPTTSVQNQSPTQEPCQPRASRRPGAVVSPSRDAGEKPRTPKRTAANWPGLPKPKNRIGQKCTPPASANQPTARAASTDRAKSVAHGLGCH